MAKRTICRKSDVRRALDAAAATGRSIAGLELRPDGSIFIRYGEPLAAQDECADDELNAVIAEIKANGKAHHSN